SPGRMAASILAKHALAALVAFLRFDRERGDRPRVEPLEADRLPRLLAVAVAAVIDPGNRGVDLADQLTLAVARAQFQGLVGLRCGTVGEVGVLRGVVV